MYKEIYLDAPNIGAAEKKQLCKAIDSGYVSTVGPFVAEFENVFARYLNIKHAVSTQSGTAALHVALYELGIGKGDEVIVPALTFVATVNPVMQVGATPVFIDVDAKNWNIDPTAIEKHITNRTKAIVPVHLYGNPCNMDAIITIAKKHKIFVIEDATESIGATYRNRLTGTLGNLGCFSFNGNKIITTGGGGMIVGRNFRIIEHARFLVNQARDASKGYYHPEIGFNYRMTNIEASLGLAQMKRLDAFLSLKRQFAAIYREELSLLGNIEFQEEARHGKSSHWFNCIMFNDGTKVDEFQDKLRRKNIPARRIFMPLIEFPPYKRYSKHSYVNSRNIYDKGLCLPSSTLNSTETIRYICKSITKIVRG